MSSHMIELKYEYEKAPAAGSAGSQSVNARQDADKYEVNYKVIPNKKKLSGFQAGDTLEFCSDQGYVTVQLTPADMFSTQLFSTDPAFCKNKGIELKAPVRIKRPGDFHYCCGFTVGYPNSDQLGNNGDTGL
jgi:hypothetical protein